MQKSVPLESFLNGRLLGQGPAIREFSAVIEAAECGPRRHGRTRAFVLLLGPTGTGKTEMVKLTASWLYDDDAARHLERFDMGEYQHRDSILRLLGGVGQPAFLGAAIDRLTALGGGILLLDEIEKAHPDLLTALLSFDDARSTMADGTVKDLSACYVIMTSNLGAAEASQMASSGYSAIRRKVLREAEQAMRKETLARYTASIVMDLLSYDAQVGIVRALLESELSLQSRHWRRRLIAADSRLLGWLVGRGYSPDMGARNLRRAVERHVGEALRVFFQSVEAKPRQGSSAEVGDLSEEAIELIVEADSVRARPFVTEDGFRVEEAEDPQVELLDFQPLRERAMEYYLGLDPQRADWPKDKLNRLVLRTGCSWALVRIPSGEMRVIGSHGQGLDVQAPTAGLWAELLPGEDDPGYFENKAFCRVRLDDTALTALGRGCLVSLTSFLRPVDEISQEASLRWRQLFKLTA